MSLYSGVPVSVAVAYCDNDASKLTTATPDGSTGLQDPGPGLVLLVTLITQRGEGGLSRTRYERLTTVSHLLQSVT